MPFALSQPAVAKSPPVFTTTCAPAAAVDAASASALCTAMSDTLVRSGWVQDATPSAINLHMQVQAITPTDLRLSLMLTRPDGQSHRIDRAFSVSDTTISPRLQAQFLQRVVAAIPPDFQ